MKRHDPEYDKYVSILHEELKPAMGCTEAIAIAYAAAKGRAALGAMPDRVKIEVSGNIIKNVKSVVVPHTGGLRGIPAAACAGIVAGDENAELEVLSHVTEEEISRMAKFMEATPVEVIYAETPHIFDIMITEYAGPEVSYVRIVDYHTNVVEIRHNEEVILEKEVFDEPMSDEGLTDREFMTVESIVDFGDCVDLDDVRDVLETQIEYNMAIAEEGLRNNYGANIGKTFSATARMT